MITAPSPTLSCERWSSPIRSRSTNPNAALSQRRLADVRVDEHRDHDRRRDRAVLSHAAQLRAPPRPHQGLSDDPAMVPEAPLEATDPGSCPSGDGWFVLNAQMPAADREGRGKSLRLRRRTEFPQVGVTLFVLGPGEPIGMYHWEADQEDFLVLSGEALLIVEGEERPLRRWDFVHCPAGTKHMIVGAGDGPCVVLGIGAREHQAGAGLGRYTVDEVALRHGAGVERETTDPDEAYKRFPGRADAIRRRLAPDRLEGSGDTPAVVLLRLGIRRRRVLGKPPLDDRRESTPTSRRPTRPPARARGRAPRAARTPRRAASTSRSSRPAPRRSRGAASSSGRGPARRPRARASCA